MEPWNLAPLHRHCLPYAFTTVLGPTVWGAPRTARCRATAKCVSVMVSTAKQMDEGENGVRGL
jgi:hypothetical protein